ncbi:outer membrane protein assembly factor BamB family protein [Salinigranum halophilum]|nr:PQQ-binding-like beta-propeller repeat protein [Salinigranum halophilum]
MAENTGDENPTLQSGDLVYLSLFEGETYFGSRHPFRETFTVLIGSGELPALEETLVGMDIGDSGTIEIPIQKPVTDTRIPHIPLSELLPESVVDIVETAGIDTPTKFAEADPDWLEEEFLLASEQVSELQSRVTEELADRRIIEYTIASAYRCRDGYRWQENQRQQSNRLAKSSDDERTGSTQLNAETEATPGAGWPMFRGNPSRTGVVQDDQFPKITSPEVLWTFDTDGGIRSSPAVDDGTVYVGSRDSRVYALSSRSGEVEWTYATGDGVNSSPAVGDRFVYIGSNDGHLYALNKHTGDKQWAVTIGSKVETTPPTARRNRICRRRRWGRTRIGGRVGRRGVEDGYRDAG